jgi:tetratricopeptide (TPR) repeat protein
VKVGCEALSPFADGQLDEPAALRFEQHLALCPQCARGLGEILVLDDLVARHADRPRRRAWRGPAAIGAVLLVAATVLLFLRRAPEARPEVLVASLVPSELRGSEARLSYGPADVHRPFAPLRGGARAAGGSVQVLGRIEETGDRRATAAAYFVLGMPAQAEVQLALLPESADVLSDRAAALLELGRGLDALALLERALRLQPGHRQASWNRALALRALGRRGEAGRAFLALAVSEGPGWAEEARAKARDLEP